MFPMNLPAGEDDWSRAKKDAMLWDVEDVEDSKKVPNSPDSSPGPRTMTNMDHIPSPRCTKVPSTRDYSSMTSRDRSSNNMAICSSSSRDSCSHKY